LSLLSCQECNKNSEKKYEITVEIAKVGETSIGRAYFEPGWNWEKCVKPIAKTESCQAPHTQYIISERMRVKMDNGSEEDIMHG
jgi:hypothetical protein